MGRSLYHSASSDSVHDDVVFLHFFFPASPLEGIGERGGASDAKMMASSPPSGMASTSTGTSSLSQAVFVSVEVCGAEDEDNILRSVSRMGVVERYDDDGDVVRRLLRCFVASRDASNSVDEEVDGLYSGFSFRDRSGMLVFGGSEA